MLRINQLSSGQSASYFSRSDYYDAEPLYGQWFGRGAKLLGLQGRVEQAAFERVMNNHHPAQDENLTPRTRSDRRQGWDFTFTAPKSISVLWAINRDQRILNALQMAVNDTLAEIERDVVTRVHHGKTMTTEKTRNMLFATFLHTTARPVGGYPDCSLHCHAVGANLTHDGSRFKAADIHLIKRDAPYFEARFHSRLASNLQHQGYAIERRGKGFEIASVSRNIIERFSARTQQIEEEAARRGITDAKQKAALGAKTREKKSQGIRPDSLHMAWRMKLTDDECEKILRGARGEQGADRIAAKQAVEHAAQHRFERSSVVRKRELTGDALRHSIGRATVAEVDREFSSRPWIERGTEEESLVTTDSILKEEQSLLAIARWGKGTMMPINPEHSIKRTFLSDEQQAAVKALLSSTDFVQTLIGKAGVGKSTVAAEFADGARKAETGVVMLAPTAKAVEVLKRDGFAADTLAKFLSDSELQQSARDKVIFLDEAGLVSTPDLGRLFDVANVVGARIVLAGDPMQHGSVGRGAAFAMLESEAGIAPVMIKDIRRQQGDYKQAVEHLSQGDVSRGFKLLNSLGWIKELPDERRYKEIAHRYVDSLEAGETALVVAPTHRERETVAAEVRVEMRKRGRISGDDHMVQTLKSYGWTKAEKQDSHNYRLGDVIEFHARGRQGFKPGDRVTVERIDGDQVTVSDGRQLPLQSAGAFDVFASRVQPFAVGEQIRVTRNRRGGDGQKRLTNGSVFTIQGFGKNGDIKIGRFGSIEPEFAHVDSAVVTSIASQGTTVDRTFVAQSGLSFAASSPEQAYVSASRSRKSVEIFTDDYSGLMRAVSRQQPKLTASELIKLPLPKAVQPAGGRIRRQIDQMRRLGQLIRGYADTRMTQLGALISRQLNATTPSMRRGT